MVVETLGDAFAAGWRITARCAWGKREGMKTRRECHYTHELNRRLWSGQGTKFSTVELGWEIYVPALPVAARGRYVSTSEPFQHGERLNDPRPRK
jgi:hypothetical protein